MTQSLKQKLLCAGWIFIATIKGLAQIEPAAAQARRIATDNTTCVSYINKKGGRKPELNEVARDIWQWAMLKRIWLTAVHLSGYLNTEADSLSRSTYAQKTEWQLAPTIFAAVQKETGELSIDLFASRLNHHCDRYISWGPDPDAMFIDSFAFYMEWH